MGALPESSPVLYQLQQNLENCYRLDPAPDVSDFVVMSIGTKREQLLMLENEDLYLTLALDQHAVDQISEGDALKFENFDDFCLIVEGISHFLMVIHRARQNRSASLLEIELQAELDKYIASMFMAHRPNFDTELLRRKIYRNYSLDESLSETEKNRYVHANNLAHRYARSLERRYVKPSRLNEMFSELRRFYRSDLQHKQTLIEA